MTTVLLLSAVPAVLAAEFDSTGLGLLALAGLVWAGALYACSMAPMIAGARRNGNEVIAAGLSSIAAIVAFAGIVTMLPLPL